MCLRFDAWCCFAVVPCPGDDYCGPSAKAIVPPHPHHHPVPAMTTHHHPPAQRDGRYGNGHRAPHQHCQLMPVAAAPDDEDRKASTDLMRRGGNGYGDAAGAACVYSGPEDSVKQMMRKTTMVVADGERCDGPHYFYHAAERHHPASATTVIHP